MFQNSTRLRTLCVATQNLYISPTKLFNNKSVKRTAAYFQSRGKKDESNLSQLFVPIQIKPNPDDISIGAELTGNLSKSDLLKVLNKFYQKKEVKQLLIENGLDSKNLFV